MNRIVSFDQIQDLINQIRNLHCGFVTNFFWNGNKHQQWIDEKTFFYSIKQESVLFVHHDCDFYQLFYVATSINNAAKHISELPTTKDLVLEILAKNNASDISLSFKKVGFEDYAHLLRMSHVGLMEIDNWNDDRKIVGAREGDIPSIHELLCQSFDPLFEQIPTEKELRSLVYNQQILLYKDDSTICGFIIYEITGQTWHLRYWFTSLSYRNNGVGSKLLQAALRRGSHTKRQILWVRANNENAIKRYEHYGFKKETMNDYIFINRKNDEKEDY